MTRSQGTPRAPRRALVFAGGGLKVAYQAGAVQVLLDEAGIEFDLADGASGGVFNLAMWCQGMTGRQIADNWRNYQPLGDFSPNLGAWLRGPWGASVLTARGLRRHTLTGFGLDWHAIRSTSREAVFELFNGPAAVRGRAADVVPARPDRRGYLHRRGIRHRREPRRNDPPRRR
jgi:predicted acylesterase/phospholipase RssA